MLVIQNVMGEAMQFVTQVMEVGDRGRWGSHRVVLVPQPHTTWRVLLHR